MLSRYELAKSLKPVDLDERSWFALIRLCDIFVEIAKDKVSREAAAKRNNKGGENEIVIV